MSLSAVRMRALEVADEMTPELRECIHEYGSAIVKACLMMGVKKPASIRFLVREIWNGARQPSQRGDVLSCLDWLLLQAGAEISAARLLRVLADNSMLIVPLDPPSVMIEASKTVLANHDERVTKTEKHRRRLKAALQAGADYLRPIITQRVPAAMLKAAPTTNDTQRVRGRGLHAGGA